MGELPFLGLFTGLSYFRVKLFLTLRWPLVAIRYGELIYCYFDSTFWTTVFSLIIHPNINVYFDSYSICKKHDIDIICQSLSQLINTQLDDKWNVSPSIFYIIAVVRCRDGFLEPCNNPSLQSYTQKQDVTRVIPGCGH